MKIQNIKYSSTTSLQILLSFVTGLCWMADSMEILLLSILSPALQCDWGITQYQQALGRGQKRWMGDSVMKTVGLNFIISYRKCPFTCRPNVTYSFETFSRLD